MKIDNSRFLTTLNNGYIIPLIMLLVGLYLVPIGIYEVDFSKIPGDFGDARFNNYVLEHGYKYISGQVDSYWSAPFMYPYQESITFSDNLLGTMPIYALFRFLSFDRETSFQLWLLVLFILNYLCTFWAIKKWSNNVVLSSVGAYIFAFSILLVGNIYNVQTMPRFVVPVSFYMLWLYLKDKKPSYLFGITISLVYQFYCGIYLGFLLFYVLLFFLIAYFLINRDKAFLIQFKNKTIIFKTLGILAFAILLMLPLMLPYYENSKTHGLRLFDDVIGTIPTLRSYFFTSKEPVFWQSLSEHGTIINSYWCHFLFLGVLPWVGLAISLFIIFSKKFVSDKKKLIQVLVLGLLLSMFFSLNFNGWTAYKLIYLLPGFSSMRSINRIINTEVMFFILIIVFAFIELSKRYKIINKIIFVLPLLVILDNLIYPQKIMRYDKQESIDEINDVKQNIILQNTQNLKNIAYMPLNKIEGRNINIHLDVMLASQELGLSCVNAYTGSLPNGLVGFWDKMNSTSLNSWLKLNNIEEKNVKIINDLGIIEKERITFTLKSIFLEKYVCVDQSINNEIVVDREEAYDWETFNFIFLNDSMGYIQSSNNKFFVCDESNELIRSSDNINFKDIFKIIQIKGDTVALKAGNNKYITISENFLIANNESFNLSSKFIFGKKQ